MKSNASNNQLGNVAVCEPQGVASKELNASLEKMKSLYQVDQQAKLLDLQAETESLLQQLQEIKQQRLADQTVGAGC
jgi:hypothetical protein